MQLRLVSVVCVVEQVETGTVKNFKEPSVQKFSISLKQIPIVENNNKEQTEGNFFIFFLILIFDLTSILYTVKSLIFFFVGVENMHLL